MSFLVWAEGEPEENGRPVDAETAEDAVSAYMVDAMRRGKKFEELARDRGELTFFAKGMSGCSACGCGRASR